LSIPCFDSCAMKDEHFRVPSINMHNVTLVTVQKLVHSVSLDTRAEEVYAIFVHQERTLMATNVSYKINPFHSLFSIK